MSLFHLLFDMRHKVCFEPVDVGTHSEWNVAKVIKFELNDQITGSKATLIFVDKPIDVIKIWEYIDIAMSDGEWNTDLVQIIIRGGLLSILIHVTLLAKVPSLEPFVCNYLTIVGIVSPTST